MPLEKCHKCGEVVEPVKQVDNWTMECCGVEVKEFLFNDTIYQWNYIQTMRKANEPDDDLSEA